MKGSEAQKQRPDELLWMLWFDEKNISIILTKSEGLTMENVLCEPK